MFFTYVQSSAGGSAPVNTVAPALSGSFFAGQVLTCSTGTWINSPTGYAYQWRLSGVNISGATSNTYTVQNGDDGLLLDCVVTASNLSGSNSADSPDVYAIFARAWWDASDLSTISHVAGSVSSWADKSGNGFSAAQAISAEQPITGTATLNGLNVIDFDGSNDSLRANGLNISQPATYCMVSVPDTNGGAGMYIHDGATSARQATIFGTTFQLFAGAGPIIGGTVVATTPYIITSEINGASSSLRANGVLVVSGNAGSSNITDMFLGRRSGGSYLNGKIAEFIAINRAINSSERTQLENYLSGKWGISI